MATLSKIKRIKYRILLKKENKKLTEAKIDEIIDYLFLLACWEEKV
jgi:hypothetical protein